MISLLKITRDQAQSLHSGPNYTIITSRVAEVAREHGWHPPKSLDWDENFKPEHTFFLSRIKICRDLHTFFWRSLGIKSAFLGKNSASWARSALLHGIYCIFY